MFELIGSKKLVRILAGVALIPIVAVGSVIYQSYTELEQSKADSSFQVNQLRESEWQAIKVVMTENTTRAGLQITTIRNGIQAQLLNNYGSMDELKTDLASNEDTKAHDIITNAIHHKYMNVDSDDNRIVVADKHKIVADNSVVASIGKRSRTWENELNSRENIQLSKTALNLILTKQIKFTFAESLMYSNVDDDFTATYPNIEYIRQDFFLNGLSAMKRYDILVPSYITDSGDIFGVPDIGSDGLRTDNDKIVLIQRYNIYDAIQVHQSFFIAYESSIESTKMDLKERISDIMLKMVLNCAIMILAFIGIIFSVIVCISWSDEGDADRGIGD